jgi:hypothetical protein
LSKFRIKEHVGSVKEGGADDKIWTPKTSGKWRITLHNFSYPPNINRDQINNSEMSEKRNTSGKDEKYAHSFSRIERKYSRNRL